MDRETLISLDVSRRREEQQKLKQTQQREMESRQVERDSRNFNQSVNATNDRYMVDALNKVRKSDVTHPESLTRMNGSWMHNRSFKK
jgi:hypothetical protein